MKNISKKLMTGLGVLALCSTNAMAAPTTDELLGATTTLTTPAGFVKCIKEKVGIKGCAPVTVANLALTASIALLKEIKAAEPHALNYAADTGSAPSPVLYSAVQKIQDAAFKQTGKNVSFDESVNAILDHM